MFRDIALCFAMITVSCGPGGADKTVPMSYDKPRSQPSYEEIPNEIKPHFSEFLEYCRSSQVVDKDTCSRNLESFYGIVFENHPIVKDQPEVVGNCQVYEVNGKPYARKIIISKKMVDYKSLQFKSLIWHELGHCLLDLDHVPFNRGIHMMNPSLMPEIELGKRWSYLVNTFFSFQIKQQNLREESP